MSWTKPLLTYSTGGDPSIHHGITPISGRASPPASELRVRPSQRRPRQSCLIRKMRQWQTTSATWTGRLSSSGRSSRTSGASGQTCTENGSSGDDGCRRSPLPPPATAPRARVLQRIPGNKLPCGAVKLACWHRVLALYIMLYY